MKLSAVSEAKNLRAVTTSGQQAEVVSLYSTLCTTGGLLGMGEGHLESYPPPPESVLPPLMLFQCFMFIVQGLLYRLKGKCNT